MKDCKIIDKCLLCDGNTTMIFPLGETPLANEFITKIEKQDMFPLNLIQCKNCDHVQLDCIVDQDRLYRNYSYVSGTSKINVKHFEDYAISVMRMISYQDGTHDFDKTILDIGSNDGTFLKTFIKYGFNVIGIDPALNIKTDALKNGVDTITEFFNEDSAINVIKPLLKGKNIKVITCNNMFAHNEDLHTIVNGVKYLLDEDGIFVIENSYLLDMCEKSLLDLIYHEHMHHHHITSLQKFFDKHEMDIFKVERLPNHGGSIRVFICRKGMKNIETSVVQSLKEEQDINSKLKDFEKKSVELRSKLTAKLSELKCNNKKIVVYGLPAKSTTLLHYFNIDPNIIEYGIDDAFLKQRKFSPGKHIFIMNDGELKTWQYYPEKIDVVLVLAWNFADDIIDKHKEFKGKWIVPLPEYKEIG